MSFRPEGTTIVFVRHTRDISSLCERFRGCGFDVKVYEKGEDGTCVDRRFCIPKNKGQEAPGYLKYIIDHYDELPPHVVLLHDHEFSWHHNGSIFDVVTSRVGRRIQYQNLNRFRWTKNTLEWFPAMLPWMDRFIVPEMGNLMPYGDFLAGRQGCAQFIVHRDVIRRRSRQFYQQLYDWLLETDLDSYYTSRYLEYTWHLFWEQVPRWNGALQRVWGWLRPSSISDVYRDIARHYGRRLMFS